VITRRTTGAQCLLFYDQSVSIGEREIDQFGFITRNDDFQNTKRLSLVIIHHLACWLFGGSERTRETGLIQ